MRRAGIRRTPSKVPRFYDDTQEITIGAAVYDRSREMPGVVRDIVDRNIILERPSGLVWSVSYRRLRPATEYEQNQLRALRRLCREQHRGLSRP